MDPNFPLFFPLDIHHSHLLLEAGKLLVGNPLSSPRPTLVQEVGFVESYDKLLRSVSLWFEYVPTVKTFILVKIDETPNYKCPNLEQSDYRSPFQLADINDIQHLHADDPFSPIFIDGLRWLGEISAFMEIWVRDPVTRKPTLKGDRLVFYGRDCSKQPSPLSLTDFANPDDHFDHPDFLLNLDYFRARIDTEKKRTALLRRNKSVEDYIKRSEGSTAGSEQK